MSFISDLITDNFEGTYEFSGDPNLQNLLETALDTTFAAAETRCIYFDDALDALIREYCEYEPTVEEVRQHLTDAEHGDWRATMTMAAILTVQARLEETIAREIDQLQQAIQAAYSAGYEAKALQTSCTHGWAAHDSETDLKNVGTLYTWTALDGDVDAWQLLVLLTDGTRLWLDLAPCTAAQAA